ncbi:MAG: sugar phosphate isomerase/epimerase [Spirochaetes bacterium]|nr:sugar phosphate isomerase/epimerase [Spirochaetota bacterium]
MRFGMCAHFDQAEFYGAMGYDYLEIPVGSYVDLDEEAFEGIAAKVGRGRIPCEAVNCFFPGSLRLTGEGVNPEAIAAHAEKALSRAARLGVKVAVVGSGGARKVPEGFDPLRGRHQFARALSIVGDAGLRHGILIVIEPLNRGETNLVNRFQDGAALAEEIDHPGVRTLIDYYHMAVEEEDSAVLLEHPGALRHVHIANPAGRVFPRDVEESAYGAFFSVLAKAGYHERMSVEGKSEDPAKDAPPALAALKTLSARATSRPAMAV